MRNFSPHASSVYMQDKNNIIEFQSKTNTFQTLDVHMYTRNLKTCGVQSRTFSKQAREYYSDMCTCMSV